MHEYDKAAKWLIQHHGNSILWLAGILGIVKWRPLQAELVHPRRLPDGLLEITFEHEPEPDLCLVEMATYPERRIVEQLIRNAMLVFLEAGRLPEIVCVTLHPKGRMRTPERHVLKSLRGLAQCSFRWRVVRLWEIPAAKLFETGDVGLVPWIPLAAPDADPETTLRRCRDSIDQRAVPSERLNLLAATQFLARLRYNDRRLLQILGGTDMIIDSPAFEDVRAHIRREALLSFLEGRFGSLPEELAARIASIESDERLKELTALAGRVPDLTAFSRELSK